MRLSEPIEKSGFFWVPEDVENRLPGVLRISEEGVTTVEVFGLSSNPLVRRPLDDPMFYSKYPDVNRVVGVVGKNEPVTLDKCFTKNHNSTLGGLWNVTICANLAFVGAVYEKGEEIEFSRIDFSVEGFDEWLGISGIRVDHRWNEKSASIHFDPPQEVSFDLPGKIEIKFSFRWKLPGFPIITGASISQRAHISLISEKLRPLDDFLPSISKIHNFLCFAIDKIVSLRSVTGYSENLTRESEEGKKFPVPIEIYYQSLLCSETESKIRQPDMLLPYRGVKDNMGRIFDRWIENHETSEPAFNLYFASKSDAYRYLGARFLSLAQAIETLHRRNSEQKEMTTEEFQSLVNAASKAVPGQRKSWIIEKLKYANELSLRKRIKEMIEPFKDYFGSSEERKNFISKIVDTRNYLTHYDDQPANQAENGESLWTLHRKLEALFQLHFLRIIGIKKETISLIVKGNWSLMDKLGLRQDHLH